MPAHAQRGTSSPQGAGCRTPARMGRGAALFSAFCPSPTTASCARAPGCPASGPGRNPGKEGRPPIAPAPAQRAGVAEVGRGGGSLSGGVEVGETGEEGHPRAGCSKEPTSLCTHQNPGSLGRSPQPGLLLGGRGGKLQPGTRVGGDSGWGRPFALQRPRGWARPPPPAQGRRRAQEGAGAAHGVRGGSARGARARAARALEGARGAAVRALRSAPQARPAAAAGGGGGRRHRAVWRREEAGTSAESGGGAEPPRA